MDDGVDKALYELEEVRDKFGNTVREAEDAGQMAIAYALMSIAIELHQFRQDYDYKMGDLVTVFGEVSHGLSGIDFELTQANKKDRS